MRPSRRQEPRSHSKRKLADHKLEEKEASARDVRRHCTGCYEKMRQQQSREASNATAKKIRSFCSDYDKFFCLDCFNKKHHTMQ